jgi:hypothetical protein
LAAETEEVIELASLVVKKNIVSDIDFVLPVLLVFWKDSASLDITLAYLKVIE